MISVINQNTMVLELGSGTIWGSVKGRKGRVALLLKNGQARRIGPFINEEAKGKFTDHTVHPAGFFRDKISGFLGASKK